MSILTHLIGLSVAVPSKAPVKTVQRMVPTYKKPGDAGESQAMALKAVTQHIAESVRTLPHGTHRTAGLAGPTHVGR